VVKSDDQHRGEMLACCRRLHELKFCPGGSGNVSVRLDASRLLVTPTAVPKPDLRPEDLVVVSPRGQKRFGRREPTSELGMHLQIYRLRHGANAVVHAHPPLATAFACAGIALDQPIASEFAMAVGQAPLAAYGTPGTHEVGVGLEALIPRHTVVLMANHGVVAWGKDLSDAFGKMELVEHFAELVLATFKLGRQSPLTESQLAKLEQAAARYGATR
jgi:L-fuculose-phosphate aldolase